ncbi:MAG: IS4 family transposase [Bacteroidetes bacterium]|nr:IS4 family transposase [Bacteroidota bacterium]
MPKHSFFTGQPVFAQLLNLIPGHILSKLVVRYQANRYYKSFMTYDHLVTMLYQGFFQCLSLRELISGMQANHLRLQHLGLKTTPRRSTLAEANSKRNADLFGELFHDLYRHHFASLPDSHQQKRLYIIDSTTVSLFSNIMRGAGSYKSDGRKKGGAKAHVLLDAHHNIPSFVYLSEARHHDLTFLDKVEVPPGSIVVFDKAYTNHSRFNEWSTQQTTWITRQKKDSSYQVLQILPVSPLSAQAGVCSDEEILLGRPSNQLITPLVKARRIIFNDTEQNRSFTFITNDLQMPAEQVAALYKQRWQIELLFKRIKQRYPLRYFLGENENAIRIQIWTALICDLLVQIVNKNLTISNNYREPSVQKGTLF